MLTAFDFFIVTLSLLMCAFGLIRRFSFWKNGSEETRSGDLTGLLTYLFAHKRILKKKDSGLAHVFLFWGFIIPLLIIILAQFNFSFPRPIAQGLSFSLDLLGAALLGGTVWFLTRRLNHPDFPLSFRSAIPLVLLLIIVITGFLAEGTRLRIVPIHDVWTSPIGWLVSFGMPDSPVFLQLLIRLHLFLVLLLIALLPFTSLKHVIVAPINVYYHSRKDAGQLTPLVLEQGALGAGTVREFSWKQLLDAEACVSCLRCQQHCPAYLSGKPLSPKKVMQKILDQMEANSRKGALPLLSQVITEEEIWACTTCLACLEQCPVFIQPLREIMDLRRHLVLGQGLLPKEARPIIRNLELYGDVQGKGRSYRSEWALNQGITPLSAKGVTPEWLFWVGCFGSFHPRYQTVARALVEILKTGKVSFGFLGKEELCCGDPARRLGKEDLFLELVGKNIQLLQKYGIKKIVTLCPHCLNTLKNEYPQSGGHFQVLHATELVRDLIARNKITLKFPLKKKVALHDPCYLSRANQGLEPLRKVLRAIPGIGVQELPRNRENSLCCGGGGGHMWLHEESGRPINHLRSQEIIETGVDQIVTACPYCLTMVEDGVGSQNTPNPPQVRDVMEVIAASLG